MPHRKIKEMMDATQASYNQLEQLADQLKAAKTGNLQQFKQVQQLSNQLAQQFQQIGQQALKGQQQQPYS